MTDIDDARSFLKEICISKFKDKTFENYIDTTLAGDFAVEIANVVYNQTPYKSEIKDSEGNELNSGSVVEVSTTMNEITNIKYYEDSDLLLFDVEEIGGCHIDNEGSFCIENTINDSFVYVPVKTMQTIIELYENRKKSKFKGENNVNF